MNDNREQISRAVDYIEAHLQDETLDLNAVTAAVGYFKYHWHRAVYRIERRAGTSLYPAPADE